MDISIYMTRQYSAQPCWELVADVYAHELGVVGVGYEVGYQISYQAPTCSVRQIAEAFRLALHETAHGFTSRKEPVELCIVLLGKSDHIGIHHCGIYHDGRVLHAMSSGTYYEELSAIKDRFEVIEYWARQ